MATARRDWAARGTVGSGLSADVSTEGFGPLCWVLWNPDVSRCGEPRHGQVRQVTVMLARVRQPLQTAALGASAPSAALFRE
jgi:hypothetical protein